MPALISIEAKGFKEATSKIRAAYEALPQTMQDELFRSAQQGVIEEGVAILQDYTPVDTGTLQRETEGYAVMEGGELHITFLQTAQDRAGVEYAPFVIFGHQTHSGSVVPPDPYPESAWPEIAMAINPVLRGVAMKVTKDMVSFMSSE